MTGGGQIIYTSGSTGSPKGVRLGLAQIDFSANALARAIDAGRDDIYLSLLPLPLLLETICALCIPLLAGARVAFEPEATRAIGQGSAGTIRETIDRLRPTATVLVPQVLMQWIGQLEAAGARAPSSLRLVAVGGAPIAPPLAEKAWSLGIPVHEGYGLSECCSVVALNRPGRRVAGSVGQPLDGLRVTIDAGEICVDGPNVMDGYTHGTQAVRPWRTGDLGHWDEHGNLVIEGRKDNLIVTANGRNISPEWIETTICADPRALAAAVTGHGETSLSAVVIPSAGGATWLGAASAEAVADWWREVCRDLPAYARPSIWHLVAIDEAIRSGLLTGNGRINRKALASFRADQQMTREPAGRQRSDTASI